MTKILIDEATVKLVERLSNEADLCRNEGANDIADLLDDAAKALAKQPTQQEPDSGDNLTIAFMAGVQRGKDLAQRTWVGLTDEEAFQICADCGCLSEDWLTLLDAIEAKLKEKNT